MIRPLRQRHAVTAMWMAVTAPLLLGFALLARPAERESSEGSDPEATDIVENAPGLGLHLTVVEVDGELQLLVTPTGGAFPGDLLAYASVTGTEGDELPTEAVFLGPIEGAHPVRFPLPLDGAGARIDLVSLVRSGVVYSETLLAFR